MLLSELVDIFEEEHGKLRIFHHKEFRLSSQIIQFLKSGHGLETGCSIIAFVRQLSWVPDNVSLIIFIILNNCTSASIYFVISSHMKIHTFPPTMVCIMVNISGLYLFYVILLTSSNRRLLYFISTISNDTLTFFLSS